MASPTKSKETTRVPSNHTFLYKPIENSESGGCHIDVFLPPKQDGMQEKLETAPIAMMIHGGAWIFGTSSHLPPDQITYLLSEGFIVVSPEYRLAPHARLLDIVEDLLDAYRWVLNDLRRELSMSTRDAGDERICLMGWSAGGTGSLLLTHAVIKNKLPLPRAVVPTYPKTDNEEGFANPMEAYASGLTREEKAQIKPLFSQPLCTGYPITANGPAQESPRIAWARAIFKTQTLSSWLCGRDSPYPPETSPINVISSHFPPVLVVVATADQLISPNQSYNLVKKLITSGVDANYVEAKGMPHAIAEEGRVTWPEDQDWWNEAILPSLEWIVRKTKV